MPGQPESPEVMKLLTIYLLAALAGAGATLIVGTLQYWGEVRRLLDQWTNERRSRRRLARARRRLGR